MWRGSARGSGGVWGLRRGKRLSRSLIKKAALNQQESMRDYQSILEQHSSSSALSNNQKESMGVKTTSKNSLSK